MRVPPASLRFLLLSLLPSFKPWWHSKPNSSPRGLAKHGESKGPPFSTLRGHLVTLVSVIPELIGAICNLATVLTWLQVF